jgi:hypothetical protein
MDERVEGSPTFDAIGPRSVLPYAEGLRGVEGYVRGDGHPFEPAIPTALQAILGQASGGPGPTGETGYWVFDENGELRDDYAAWTEARKREYYLVRSLEYAVYARQKAKAQGDLRTWARARPQKAPPRRWSDDTGPDTAYNDLYPSCAVKQSHLRFPFLKAVDDGRPIGSCANKFCECGGAKSA